MRTLLSMHRRAGSQLGADAASGRAQRSMSDHSTSAEFHASEGILTGVYYGAIVWFVVAIIVSAIWEACK
jgi:hypothetical protein